LYYEVACEGGVFHLLSHCGVEFRNLFSESINGIDFQFTNLFVGFIKI